MAVDQFLAAASLGPASRRVYRISLASWAWMLVGMPPPIGAPQDVGRLDLSGHRARIEMQHRTGPAWAAAAWIQWRSSTTELLSWLVAGRAYGPVFLTGRRAPTRAAAADICPITGGGADVLPAGGRAFLRRYPAA